MLDSCINLNLFFVKTINGLIRHMKKFDRVIIWMFGFFMLLGIIKKYLFDKKKDEIIIEGRHVSKAPCLYAINELFGRGLDSVKMCDCIIPAFYEMIKHDSSKMEKFEKLGFFQLEGPANDSLIHFFADCARKSILDSELKVNTSQFAQSIIIDKYKKQFDSVFQFKDVESDSLIRCVLNELDGKLTIKEFFANDTSGNEKIKSALIKCIHNNIRK